MFGIQAQNKIYIFYLQHGWQLSKCQTFIRTIAVLYVIMSHPFFKYTMDSFHHLEIHDMFCYVRHLMIGRNECNYFFRHRLYCVGHFLERVSIVL